MDVTSAVLSATSTTATASGTTHPLLSLFAAAFWVILWLLDWARSIIAFVTIRLPIFVYAVLSYSLTFTLDFWTLLSLFVVSTICLSFYIRFKYLNPYEHLTEPPLLKPDAKELHPDINTPFGGFGSENRGGAFHHYLDEFLIAIRVFGFLEKPVFHELSRHLQTRRLIAGDTILLDSEKDRSFYCVIDGTVQVFAPSNLPGQSQSEWDDTSNFDGENIKGYQLLNEVGRGGTLSSLFTILSLFTEDVDISWKNDDESDFESEPGVDEGETRRGRAQFGGVEDLDGEVGMENARDSDSTFTVQGDQVRSQSRPRSQTGISVQGEPFAFVTSPSARSESVGPSVSERQFDSHSPYSHRSQTQPQFQRGSGPRINGNKKREPPSPSHALRGMLARATEDTTLAVIPAEAFRRLTQKFPKASGHIVQVILTRFSRVTFNAAHRYLGLTSELLRAEKAINELARHPLPSGFYEGGGMEWLRLKFPRDMGSDAEGEGYDTEKEKGKDYFGFDKEKEMDGEGRRRFEGSSTSSNTTARILDLSGPKSKHTRQSSTSTQSQKSPILSSRSLTSSPTRTASQLPSRTSVPSGSSTSLTSVNGTFPRPTPSRDQVQAGDLHTSAANPGLNLNVMGLGNVMNMSMKTPRSRISMRRPTRWGAPFGGGGNRMREKRKRRTVTVHIEDVVKGSDDASHQESGAGRLGGDDGDSEEEEFNLRDEVMACIAKSIGLLRPQRSHRPSNTYLQPQDGFSNISSPTRHPLSPGSSISNTAHSTTGGSRSQTYYRPSFGSLSMLDRGYGDDESSSIAASEQEHSVANSRREYMIGLDNEVEILFFPAGSILVKAGERNAGLFYVIDGFLDISIPLDEGESSSISISASQIHDGFGELDERTHRNARRRQSKENMTGGKNTSKARRKGGSQRYLFTVKRGGIAGYLASLSGFASYVDIRAKTDTYVGFLPSNAMDRLLEKRPIVLLTLSKRLLSLLSPLVLYIDSALDWVQVNAGQIIWRPGDISDSLYIVINGRLRALKNEEEGRVAIAGEYGQGDTIGELDVITHTRRSSTVHAIRDTELVRIPLTLFNAISRNPQATVHLLKLIASRVRDEVEVPDSRKNVGGTDLGRGNFNLKTVALLPVSSSVPITAFGKKLYAALEGIGAPTAYLDQTSVMNHVGRHAFTRMGNLKVAGWLAEQEQRYRIVLYVADAAVGSQWTQTCIRQADYVMVVGLSDDPSIGDYEKMLLSSKTTARKELVLLHSDRSVAPSSTREWLKNRNWIHAHFHVELPGLVSSKPSHSTQPSDPAAVKALKKVKNRVQTEIQKYRGLHSAIRPPRPDHASDFARLARRLCGRTIGVVFGGGGARGLSHLGVLRALEDYGIPIDHVGGTSIGAFMGGLYAQEGDLLAASGRAKQFAARMSSLWRMLADVTYPIVAYTTGHAFNRTIYKSFYDTHIEDMWLPYFCNSTNILKSRMEIHETGYAWRYIRASMTLVGLLPPLCDNGQMLVDGGYVDNLPVRTMLSMGAHAVFAVDVSAIDDNSPRSFGDTVSGWWLFLTRWNPFYRANGVPPITEIQQRLAYVSSVNTLEDAKSVDNCLYMRMPVENYGTLQWNKFDEIVSKGYKAALEMLAKWDQEHKLPSYSALDDGGRRLDSGGVVGSGKMGRKGRSQRRNSI